jgi:uncharacterized protein
MTPSGIRFVIAPGYLDSDPDHWQTRWQADLGDAATRTAPRSWTEPEFDDWVSALDAVMVPDAVIVAHSLGCLTALAWLERHPSTAAGAFLVAVPDAEGPDFPPQITGFTRPSRTSPVPTLMVASTDDPYSAIEVSRATAAVIGADLVEIEAGGHLSTASGRGPWPEGRALLDRFVSGLATH